jgi:sulfane dehydrogenase subunit SoxC
MSSIVLSRRNQRRRQFLGAGLATLAGTAAAPVGALNAAENPDKNLPPNIPEWMRVPGAGITSPPYGLPSRYESGVVRRPA